MSFGKCSICDSQVLYNEDAVLAKCSICGKEESTYILCEESHYVCADCCAKEVMNSIREIIPDIKQELSLIHIWKLLVFRILLQTIH